MPRKRAYGQANHLGTVKRVADIWVIRSQVLTLTLYLIRIGDDAMDAVHRLNVGWPKVPLSSTDFGLRYSRSPPEKGALQRNILEGE